MKYGSDEWYLYHHIKNETPIIPLILLSGFLFICKGGILLIILIWIWYFSWAHKNNEILNSDPDVIKRREYYKQEKEKYNKFN